MSFDPFVAIGVCGAAILFLLTLIRSLKPDFKFDYDRATTPPFKEKLSAPELSPETLRRVDIMFQHGEDRERVKTLLYEQCGHYLWPLEADVDRLRFAALKYSKGSLTRLESAVSLAQVDWRDLLVAAGFANDPNKHRRWVPKPPGEPAGSRHTLGSRIKAALRWRR